MFPVLKTNPTNHRLIWKFYGKNAVMADLEPTPPTHVHEIGLYGEVLAPTQSLANAIANCARVGVLHGAYPGQVATAGNLANAGTPLELAAGPVCEFTIYHLMEIDDPSDFPIEHFTVGEVGNKRKLAPKTNGHVVANGQTKELIPLKPEPLIHSYLSELPSTMYHELTCVMLRFRQTLLSPRSRPRRSLEKLRSLRAHL